MRGDLRLPGFNPVVETTTRLGKVQVDNGFYPTYPIPCCFNKNIYRVKKYRPDFFYMQSYTAKQRGYRLERQKQASTCGLSNPVVPRKERGFAVEPVPAADSRARAKRLVLQPYSGHNQTPSETRRLE